jgi:MFS family permease
MPLPPSAVVVYYNTMPAVPEAEPSAAPPPTPARSPDFYRLAVFFAAIYFVQGFAEPKAGIAAQPIFFLLKEEMRLSAGDTATFLALVGVAWTIKPLYGLLSDLVPLAGYRRRSYLLVTTVMAGLGWLVLGLLPAYPYGLMLAILGLTGLGLAFTDVLCDAVMVEEGKPRGLTGTFQSIQWGSIYAASLIAGVGGGYLAAHVSYSRTFLLVACFPVLSLAASAYAVREPKTRLDRASVSTTLQALRAGVRSGPLWRAAAFLFLWNFSPSFGVPLEFYMVDVLGISKIRLGLLATIGWWSAVLLQATVGLVTIVAFLATMDLAARAVPAHAEGTFFAALMSVNNLGTTGSAWLGGRLYDVVGLQWLIAISAATTAACWLLVPWVRPESLSAPSPRG